MINLNEESQRVKIFLMWNEMTSSIKYSIQSKAMRRLRFLFASQYGSLERGQSNVHTNEARGNSIDI